MLFAICITDGRTASGGTGVTVLTHPLMGVTSVEYTYYYNAIGKITLVYPATLDSDRTFNASSLRLSTDYLVPMGAFIWDQDNQQAWICQRRVYRQDNGTITCYGISINGLLNYRGIRAGEGQNGNVSFSLTTPTDIYNMIRAVTSDMTSLAMPGINIPDASTVPGTFSTIVPDGGQLLDSIIPVLDAWALGHRMILTQDFRSCTFEIYPGIDRSSTVVISDTNGTARNFVIDDDYSLARNLVTFSISGTTTIPWHVYYTDCGFPVTADRLTFAPYVNRIYEISDGSTISLNQALSVADFEKLVYGKATSSLSSAARRLSISCDIPAADIGVAYNLGDIVTVRCDEAALSHKARIAGIRYKMDAQGENTTLIVGTVPVDLFDYLRFGN